MVASSTFADPNDFLAACGRLARPGRSDAAVRAHRMGAASPETLTAHSAAELAHLRLLVSGAPEAEVRAAARKVKATWALCGKLRRLVPRPRPEDGCRWVRVSFEVGGLPFHLTLDPRQAWQAAGGKDTMPVLTALRRWAGRSWNPRDVRYAAHGRPAEASLAATKDAAAYLGGTFKVLGPAE